MCHLQLSPTHTVVVILISCQIQLIQMSIEFIILKIFSQNAIDMGA